MKSLEKIQKTFKVFKTLSKVAMIMSFVWAGIAMVGALCAVTWKNGGTVVGPGMETWQFFSQTADLNQMLAVMISDTVFALTDGILFLCAFLYFKAEQVEGTPFTLNGAGRIKRLGIQIIVIPLVAVIISSVIYGCFDVKNPENWGNGAYVVLGIAMILASQIFRYGAELEKNRMERN